MFPRLETERTKHNMGPSFARYQRRGPFLGGGGGVPYCDECLSPRLRPRYHNPPNRTKYLPHATSCHATVFGIATPIRGIGRGWGGFGLFSSPRCLMCLNGGRGSRASLFGFAAALRRSRVVSSYILFHRRGTIRTRRGGLLKEFPAGALNSRQIGRRRHVGNKARTTAPCRSALKRPGPARINTRRPGLGSSATAGGDGGGGRAISRQRAAAAWLVGRSDGWLAPDPNPSSSSSSSLPPPGPGRSQNEASFTGRGLLRRTWPLFADRGADEGKGKVARAREARPHPMAGVMGRE